jgi:hypothetical protein
MPTCEKDHANVPKKEIEKLSTSQADVGRHRCALCAYELGRQEATGAEERLRERVRGLLSEVDALKRKLEAVLSEA